MSEWQDIVSAPKDGSYIIAARFSGQALKWVKHSRWITADEIAEIECGEPDEYEAGWTDGDDDGEPCYPTHWLPWPLPPSPTQDAGGDT